MMNTSRTIVFFGTDEFSLATLTGLIEADYTFGAVVTKPDAPSGRGHKLTPPPVKVLASKHNIPVWQPNKLQDIEHNIRALGKPIGVLSSYGKIIPQSIIDLFDPGIINIHPSLLPLHRGPTPIETVIAEGEEKTGVSIMQLSAAMDAGPIYIAKEFPLTGSETKPELYHSLATVGTNLLLEALPGIMDGSLTPAAQNEAFATYTKLLGKDDAWLNPQLLTAVEAERKIRANLGFPKTKLLFEGYTIIITSAHVAQEQLGPMTIVCKDTTYLAVDEVIAPSGRRMSSSDFIRGYLRA